MMNLRRFILGLLLAVTVQGTGADRGLSFDFQKHPERAASVYIAPENLLIWRLRTPGCGMREFEMDYSHPGIMRSLGGWSARFGKWPVIYGKGASLDVVSAPDTNGVRLAMRFDNGRLISFEEGKVTREFARDAVPMKLNETESPLLASGYDGENTQLLNTVKKQFDGKWKKTGRLLLPWNNPNRNAVFWGELSFLFLGFALLFGRMRWRIAFFAFGVLTAVPCVACGSRGALLGAAVAVMACGAARPRDVVRLVKSKAFLICAGIAVLALVTWVCTNDTRFLTRGGSGFGGNGWSNRLRVDIWKNSLLMFVDAPWGWSWWDDRIGHAYFDWYQPIPVTALTGSLISDHLTRLAALGWPLRCVYIALWLFLVAVAMVRARASDFLPLAVTVFFAVAAWFNPVFAEPVLWVMFAAAWIPTVIKWRTLTFRQMSIFFGASMVLGILTAAAFYIVGNAMDRNFVRVFVSNDGRRIAVKGENPRAWAVDDWGESFGSTLVCKGIRWHYLCHPQSAPMGLVHDVDDLPATGVERLVLGGKSGDAWLKRVCSSEEARAHLPKEVIFISPPFPPEAIPPPLFEACKVKFVVGEFAAAYQPKLYKTPPDFVEIVPGMELYIANWVDYATR